jgi:hypothetical protein
METLQLYDKKHLIQKQDLGLYKGDIAIAFPEMEGEPRLDWTGAPIDHEQFRLAVAFLKWTHDTYKIEGQARFWYNPETCQWRTVVLPQEKWSAGHTREVEEEVEAKEQIITELMADGFGEAGTIHHHSNMSAFQSGGDKTDELSRSGFHCTVGRMGCEVADFHGRATFKGINYEQENGMMDCGQWLPGLRTKRIPGGYLELDKDIARFWLDLKDLPEFPEEWKALVVDRPATTTYHSHGSYCGYAQNQGVNHANRSNVQSWRGRSYGRTVPEINKDLHAHDTPCYKSKTITVWLKDPTATFRVNIRLPKAQRDAINASTTGQQEMEMDMETVAPMLTVSELRKLNRMDATEFNAYLKELRKEGRVDDSSIRDDVEVTIADALAEYRDEYISDHVSALALEEMFGELQRISARLARMIELTSGNLTCVQAPDKEHFRDLTIVWINRLTELFHDMHPEQWEVLQNACKQTSQNAPAFYELLCQGIEAGQQYGVIEERYNDDGTVLPHERAPADVDSRKRFLPLK